MANIPKITATQIMQVEAEFITVFMFENLDLDQQSLSERMINHSFHDKVEYLADRADVLLAARKYFERERKKRIMAL